jgi:hypothetical protein
MIEAHYVITDVIDDTDYEGVGCGTCGNGMELVGTETLVYEIRDTPTGETLYEQTLVNADLEYGTDAAKESADYGCPVGKIKDLGRITAPELSLRLKGQKLNLEDVLNRHGLVDKTLAEDKLVELATVAVQEVLNDPNRWAKRRNL